MSAEGKAVETAGSDSDTDGFGLAYGLGAANAWMPQTMQRPSSSWKNSNERPGTFYRSMSRRVDAGSDRNDSLAEASRHQRGMPNRNRSIDAFGGQRMLPANPTHARDKLDYATSANYDREARLSVLDQLHDVGARMDLNRNHHEELLQEYNRRLLRGDSSNIPRQSEPTAAALRQESLRRMDDEIFQLRARVRALKREQIARALDREGAMPLQHRVEERRQEAWQLSPAAIRRAVIDATDYQRDSSMKDAKQGFTGTAPSSQQEVLHTEIDSVRARLSRGEGIPVVQSTDKSLLSDYQLAIRESLCFFQMHEEDVLLSHVPGRKNKPLPGQIGLRCRFCDHLPHHRRGGGAIYFPGGLASIYQAAQNISSNHLLKTCKHIPDAMKERLVAARNQLKKEPRRSGGNSYWMETSRHLGLEDRRGCRGVWVKSDGPAGQPDERKY